MIASSSHKHQQQAIFALRLTAIFALAGLIGILNHEMWRDELQAWMLARDSQSVVELIQNMRTEGHPALWHLCLWGLARLSHRPLLMQLFHISLATVSVYLINRFSPFSRLQQTLLTFSYFTFYEYALISRSYALGVLLVFLFCTLYTQSPDVLQPRPIGQTLGLFGLLALLANTSVYGVFLSLALGLALVWPLNRLTTTVAQAAAHTIGLGVLGLGWLLSYAQVSRINDGSATTYLANPETVSDPNWPARAGAAINHIWRSYIPVPNFLQSAYGKGNILADTTVLPNVSGRELGEFVALVGAVIVVLLFVRIFWPHPKWLAVYACGMLAQSLFSVLFFSGSLRHHGHLFVLLIVCLWLMQVEQQARSRSSTAQPTLDKPEAPELPARYALPRPHQWQCQLLTGLLALQAFSGAYAYSVDLSQPFSGSRSAAQFLQANQLDQLPILGYRDREAATLSGYLDRPIYYPNLERFGSFWTVQTPDIWTDIGQHIQAFVAREQQPVILALTDAIDGPIPGIALQPLLYSEGVVKDKESFYLYLATAQ